MIDGQVNLRDAVNRTIEYLSPDGKRYALNDRTATLLVRPRGWHLSEAHILVDGAPVSGSILDFALYRFHNAKALIAQDSGPYFYLPKLESLLEARLWNDIFVTAQRELGVPLGTIKATVRIETVLAAFEMDEILYELRDHRVGLNIGRWDYIFSCIKKFRSRHDVCLADRAAVSMTAPFMRAYALLLIRTCHRRNAFAMGGMAAEIPIQSNEAANEAALEMEDAATAEIARSQLWQWIRSPKGVLEDGRKVARELVHALLPEELARVRRLLGEAGWQAGRYDEAARLFERMTASDDFVEFLTFPGYQWLTREPRETVAA